MWELGVPILHSWKSRYNFWFFKTLTRAVPLYLWWIGSGTSLWIPKSTAVQVPYIKWLRTMYTVGLLYLQIPNCGWKILFLICDWWNLWMQNPGIWMSDYIFIFNNLQSVSGLMQFKPMLHIVTKCPPKACKKLPATSSAWGSDWLCLQPKQHRIPPKGILEDLVEL